MVSISVIIPAYNRSKTIINCVQSVINQTYPVSEIIIVDDRSDDNTIDVVNTINDDRIITVKHDTNKGAQAARNTGIKTATSDWIAFLDSDDEWLPKKIEHQVNKLEKANKNPYTVVHCNCYKNLKNKRWVNSVPRVEGMNAHNTLLKYPSPLFPAILTSRKALEEIGYLDENVKTHQEWETSIRLSFICNFIHIEEPLFIWYLEDKNSISKNNKRHIEGYQYIINKHKNEILKIDSGLWWDRHLITLARKCLLKRLRKQAPVFLKKVNNRSLREYFDILFCYKYHISPDFYDNWLNKKLFYILEAIYLGKNSGFKMVINKFRQRIAV